MCINNERVVHQVHLIKNFYTVGREYMINLRTSYCVVPCLDTSGTDSKHTNKNVLDLEPYRLGQIIASMSTRTGTIAVPNPKPVLSVSTPARAERRAVIWLAPTAIRDTLLVLFDKLRRVSPHFAI